MNYDEFAFFNQQLGAMLRDGIPLEGALKQLAAGMKSGALRAEIELMESDLARGLPLKDAIARRRLPRFYTQMIELGARANDLPGVLTLLADYYHRANALWNRLKGLMVYPFIVVTVSLALTIALSLVFQRFANVFSDQLMPTFPLVAAVWLPPALLAICLVVGLIVVLVPASREKLRWRIPAFREASLARLASAMTLMLKSGTTLPEALALAEAVESGSPAARALAHWRRLVESGQGKPAEWSQPISPFPQMFVWLVQKGGEDVAAGFEKAAEVYHTRASYHIELALYGALPISILLLGQMVFWQIAPLIQALVQVMNNLGGGFE